MRVGLNIYEVIFVFVFVCFVLNPTVPSYINIMIGVKITFLVFFFNQSSFAKELDLFIYLLNVFIAKKKK